MTMTEPKPLTAAEWATSFVTLAVLPLPIEAPSPWQRAAVQALGLAPSAAPVTLAGLPLVVGAGVPASTLFLLAARPGRSRAMFNALRLALDDERNGPESPPALPVVEHMTPCHYHRFCKGFMDSMFPTQDNLCPECFESTCWEHEQAEIREHVELMAAEGKNQDGTPL